MPANGALTFARASASPVDMTNRVPEDPRRQRDPAEGEAPAREPALPADALRTGDLSAASVLRLQRLVGNAAVSSMLAGRRGVRRDAVLDSENAVAGAEHFFAGRTAKVGELFSTFAAELTRT